jgi:hypothetical protein
MVETDHEKLVMGRQFGQCLVAVRVVSSEALVLATVPVMVLMMGSLLPSCSLTQEALIRRVDGVSLEGNGG